MSQIILAARFTHFAAGMALFGAPLFLFYVLPPTAAREREIAGRAVRRILRVALPAAALSAIVWAGASLADVTGEPRSLADPEVLSEFFLETGFGRVALLRLLVLAAASFAFALSSSRNGSAAVVSAAAVLLVSQSLLGHAGASEGAVAALLVAIHGLHALGAAAWIGGLLPLIALLHAWSTDAPARPDVSAGRVLWRFSRAGIVAVSLAGSAGCASAALHLRAAGLAPPTLYGGLVLGKVLVFLCLVAVAARNRQIAAGLHRSDDLSTGLARIDRNSRTEIALAALALLLAAALGMSDPGA